MSVYCLAYLLHHEKQYKDAEVFYHRAYSEYKKTLREKHPTTVGCSPKLVGRGNFKALALYDIVYVFLAKGL